jgi:hypothetical protein
MEHPVVQSCACPCGKSTFQISARPFARFYCHCTICQSLYKHPFADATMLWARDVALPDGHNILFKKYRSPPAISRGTCGSCGSPVVAFSGFGASRLAFVAARNYSNPSVLPESAIHIFYHRRASEAADNLPKYSGYLRSEAAVMSLIVRGIFRREAA